MLKTYTIKKGTQIVIVCHDWRVFESYKEVVNTTLDEDISLRCRDGLNEVKLFKMLRKKYNLEKDAYCSYLYKYKVEEVA